MITWTEIKQFGTAGPRSWLCGEWTPVQFRSMGAACALHHRRQYAAASGQNRSDDGNVPRQPDGSSKHPALFAGDKAFSFYVIDELVSVGTGLEGSCPARPYPIIVGLTRPIMRTWCGQLTVTGWSYSEDLGIDTVELMLNGKSAHHYNMGCQDQTSCVIRM